MLKGSKTAAILWVKSLYTKGCFCRAREQGKGVSQIGFFHTDAKACRGLYNDARGEKWSNLFFVIHNAFLEIRNIAIS